MSSREISAREELGRRLRRRFLQVVFGLAAAGRLGGAAIARAEVCSCPGDLTINALQDGGDVQRFVECLLSGPGVEPGCACADVNGDAALDDLDVAGLVAILLARQSCYTLDRELEPGTWHTPPASPCQESACGGRGDLDAGMGIYLFSGEVYHSAQDLRIRGRGFDFVWARKYRSRFGPDTAQGNGWDFSYNIYLEQAGPDLVLHDGNSRTDAYLLQPSGKWAREEFFREIEQNIDDSFTLIFADTSRWDFHAFSHPTAPGRLSSIVDRNGNTMGFDYDAQGRLVTIHDTLDTAAHNRDITVSYDANGFIASVTDFTGRSVTYQYYDGIEPGGNFGDLKSVTSPAVVGTPNGNDFPAGKTTTYTYSTGSADDRLNHNLLSITDPKGQTYLNYVYASVTNPDDIHFDRAIRQVWGDPGDIIDWTITGFSTIEPYRIVVTVNDREGNVSEYAYDGLNRLVRKREFTGQAPNPDLPTTGSENLPIDKFRLDDPELFETNWEYNGDSMVTRVIYPNLNETQSVYEADLNPAAEPRIRGNLREVHRLPGPLGGDQGSITETYTYETGFGGCGCGTNFVKTHTDGRGNTTMYSYDAAGNRLQTIHRIPTIVEDFEYNAFGQMTLHRLPANGSGSRREDVFSYYTPADGCMNGYLKDQIIDQPGFALTTTYEYDCLGRVTRQIDPRGNDLLTEYNALDQVVREQSREALPGIRYERLTWYDTNDNAVRTDIQNLDETGNVPPGGNTRFSTITEYEVLNYPTRICREKGSALLGSGELDCAALPLSEFIVEEYEYDANRNQTLMRYGQATSGADLFNTLTTSYDERDLVFQSIRAAGSPLLDESTDQTDYDGNGNVRATRQGLEDVGGVRVTEYAYDGYDRRTSMTDAMGNVTTYHYDANGNRVSQRIDGEINDVAGDVGNVRLGETTYAYDAMDRRTQQDVAFFDTGTQNPILDGFSTTQWAYADDSQVTGETDDNGHSTSYGYDTANRRSVVTDAKNNQVLYEQPGGASGYDANSNVVSVKEIDKSDLGNPDEIFFTSYVYDNLDRLTTTTDNVGNLNQYAYDSRSNRVLYTDARNNSTRYHYDGVNRLTRTVRDMDALGPDDNAQPGDLNPDIVTTQDWDDSSRLTGQTDDSANATAYQYDALDRRTMTNYADCTTDSTTYDVHDNATQTTDANGTVVLANQPADYDLLDRLLHRAIAPGPGVSADTTVENYQYDGRSRMIIAEDDDSEVTFFYDSLSNLFRENQQILPGGPLRIVFKPHDGEGNQLCCIYPSGRTIVREYDELDRPAAVGDGMCTVPVTINSLIASYDYIGRARVERRDNGNNTRLDLTYDGIRRITGTDHMVIAGATIDQRTYDWDPNSNKLAMHRLAPAPPEDRLYLYDAVNRLINSQITNGCPSGFTNYQLDGVGNRLQVFGGPNPGPYTMDPLLCEPADFQMNQYTTTPFNPQRLYDANGNFTSLPGSAQFSYDYRNRLVQFDNLIAGQTTTYRYDCLGRRTEKNVDGTITRFYYDGWREIVEQDGANLSQATHVWSACFRSDQPTGADPDLESPGPGIGVEGPLRNVMAGAEHCGDVLETTRGGQQFFFHGDDQGSTLKATDQFGNNVESYCYEDYGTPSFFDAFGNPIAQSNISNPWGFHGHFFDAESGLYYLRMRYLATGSGRFIQRIFQGISVGADPLGNPYSFGSNNPTSLVSFISPQQGPPAGPAPPPRRPNVAFGYAPGRFVTFRQTAATSPWLAQLLGDVNRSRVDNRFHRYESQGGIPFVSDPGFDCDDFASLLELRLSGRGYDASYTVYWQEFGLGFGTTVKAHAVTDVHAPDGTITFIEPQTGAIVDLDFDGDGLVEAATDHRPRDWYTENGNNRGGRARIEIYDSRDAAEAAGVRSD